MGGSVRRYRVRVLWESGWRNLGWQSIGRRAAFAVRRSDPAGLLPVKIASGFVIETAEVIDAASQLGVAMLIKSSAALGISASFRAGRRFGQFLPERLAQILMPGLILAIHLKGWIVAIGISIKEISDAQNCAVVVESVNQRFSVPAAFRVQHCRLQNKARGAFGIYINGFARTGLPDY